MKDPAIGQSLEFGFAMGLLTREIEASNALSSGQKLQIIDFALDCLRDTVVTMAMDDCDDEDDGSETPDYPLDAPKADVPKNDAPKDNAPEDDTKKDEGNRAPASISFREIIEALISGEDSADRVFANLRKNFGVE